MIALPPIRLGVVANNGQESHSQTNNNASTNDESGVGEAPEDNDYQAPPPMVAFGGGGVTKD